MPVTPSSLSIDEFAALVAAALGDIDCGKAGGSSRLYCVDGQQERPRTPPTTSVSASHPPIKSWSRKKAKFESWSASSARFCGATTDSFLDPPHKTIEYPSLNVGSHLGGPSRKARATQMTTYTSEPTVLAASMSTVDLGNCLGLVGGGCGSCSCAGLSSRNVTGLVSGRNTGGNLSTRNTNSNTIPTVPVFTLEVEEGTGLERTSEGYVGLEPNVIDLGSTLRLPRKPSSFFRKSAPDLRIQDSPPRNLHHQPESPRSPRKSFFSKLVKQLSSKASPESQSSPNISTISAPNSNIAHTDGSPRGFPRLHLSLPLTPLSFSASPSPNSSRSPSPRFPFRAASASYKRESAPPTVNVVQKPHSPGAESPKLSPSDCPALRSGGEGKRRIHPVHDCHYAASSDQDSRPVEKHLTEDMDQHTRNNSILSLADCMVWESRKSRAQMSWTKRPNRRRSKKTNSISEEVIKGHSDPGSQPFPTSSQPESDEILSDPSKYSCESAPRSRPSLKLGNLNHETSEARAAPNTNGTVLPGAAKSEPESPIRPPPQISLGAKPEEEPIYAPFVPLVFQHERLQQTLQKSVPLASFEGVTTEAYKTVACLKSVPLKSYPPRTTSLSSSAYFRKRTKSAPNLPHDEKFTHDSATPPVPTLPTNLASIPTTVRNHSMLQTAPKKNREVERPATAPADSAPHTTSPVEAQAAAIPFPVKETEPKSVAEEDADSERQRKSSKLRRLKLRRSHPSPLQPSTPSYSTGNADEHSNSHNEVGSGSRTGTTGLKYSLSLSKHPYAQARLSEGMLSSPEEADPKPEAKRTSLIFLPSTANRESSRLQSSTKPQRRFKVAQNLMPSSPMSPTSISGSGSGSEASSKSPVTPRSPPYWSGGVNTGATVKSKIGLGISVSGSEDGQQFERKDSALINSDGITARVVRTSDNADAVKKGYKPPHPYSRSYSTNIANLSDEENTMNDTRPFKENPRNSDLRHDRPSTASSLNRRPAMQTILHHGTVPSKPPPIDPLPWPPGAVRGSDLAGEVPPSPVPSEYVKSFSNPAPTGDDDSGSYERTAASYPPSQSSESYGHDPEYEALLAANTRANVGELASMRNIGVGRRLMSGCPHPLSSRMDSTSKEEKRKRVQSEAARHPEMGGEWTLFLGNDGTPPRREDIIADLNSVPMTGIKTLGVRARTKSESALNALGLGNNRPCGMKRARSSIPAPGSSTQVPPPAPVPPLVKKRQVPKSDDWTLSLPLLPPDKVDPIKLHTVEDLPGPNRIPNPLAVTSSRGAKPPTRYPEPEVIVCVEGVIVNDEFNLDDVDDMTVAESQVVDASFALDIDSLDLEDDEDDFSRNSAPYRRPGLPFDGLLFSVPRVVSKGSGMECATWGEVDEEIFKRRGRRLSDGLESLMGMAGVSVRVDVNEDGESVCIVDGLSLNTEEVEDGSQEGSTMEEHESVDPVVSDAMKENLARLDALSEDLKRFNELLKEGVSTTTVTDLKHARSYGVFPPQREAKSDHLRQQSLDALRDLSANSTSMKPTLAPNVNDRVKAWTERSVAINSPPNVPVSSSPRPSSPPMNPIAMKSRAPLPFAPSFPPNYARLPSRGPSLGIGLAIPHGTGRSATGRATTIATQTKPSHLTVVPAIAAAMPDSVVGSGLKVGGNGRVISLSCSSAAAPVVASTQTGSLRVDTKEKRPAVIVNVKDDEKGEGKEDNAGPTRDTKRNSVSSSISTDSFFTSFSSPSQAPTPPPNRDMTLSKQRQGSTSSDCSSSSDTATPTATPPPGLRIITSSTTNSTRAQSPIDDVLTPSSSAMPTPLASSFPAVPPLPVAFSSLGEDLTTVSRILLTPWTSRNWAMRNVDKPKDRLHYSTDCEASILSCTGDVSGPDIVQEPEPSRELSTDVPLHSATERERDTESMYSGSFYSARSSFEA